MSREAVMKFLEDIHKDGPASERLRAVGQDREAFSRLSTELGRERGFVFAPSDVQAALDALAEKRVGELSDQELSLVAGGYHFLLKRR